MRLRNGRLRGAFAATAFGTLFLLNGAPTFRSVPALAQGNTRLAFASDRRGNHDIYTMDPDGGALRRLTDDPRYDLWPSWSPDGRRIAFVRSRGHAGGAIYSMTSAGTDERLLTDRFDGFPSWSPDGQRIVFQSSREGGGDIYVMDADGKNQVRLTDHPAGDYTPAWSPDGRRIAFSSARDEDEEEIYVVDVDGRNLRRLTFRPGRNLFPAWSPDGRWIAFIGLLRPGASGLFMMRADGREVRRVAERPFWESYPTWSPDGKWLAFASFDRDIYLVGAQGQGLHNITNHKAKDESPSWYHPAWARRVSPAGKRPFTWGWLKELPQWLP